jgi:signal peptidase II
MHLAAVYNLFGLNQPLFFVINGAHTAALDHIMMAGSTLGDFWNLPWIVVALVLMRAASESPEFGTASRWLPAPATSARVVLALVASFLPAAALVGLLKVGLHMPRPPVALPIGTVHVVGKPESPFSFPSGHAAFAMLLTVVLWTHCRRWIRLALIGLTA